MSSLCPHLSGTLSSTNIPEKFNPKEYIHAELTVTERAAHEVPNFHEDKEQEPILYLPPLLSRLPHSHHQEEEKDESDKGPLHTETHLPSIDPVSLSLHRALHKFKPIDSHYSSVPYGQAFNWATLELPLEEEREWYCVAFRSRRRPGSESGRESELYLRFCSWD